MSRIRIITLIVVIIIGFSTKAQSQHQLITSGYAEAIQYTVEVINTYPHDTSAYTQGLLLHDGTLYESTGQTGESTLRQVDITTGAIIRSIDVTRTAEELLEQQNYFAEGLELVNGQLIQLTWTSQVALVYDLNTFEQTRTFTYDGQGWGLCYDERYLYMSDSTQYLAIREADTFELIGRMLVTLNGTGINANLLNELECVGDFVYANLWQTDYIVQINKYNGNVLAIIDASNLLTDDMIREIPNFREDTSSGIVIPPSGAVLNGIAYNPATDTFYITGKYWSRLFEVRFVPIN